MAKEMTLLSGESLNKGDSLAGAQWRIPPSEHVGHIVTVLGRVSGTSMFVVKCECGEFWRMSYPTIRNGLDRIGAIS